MLGEKGMREATAKVGKGLRFGVVRVRLSSVGRYGEGSG